MKSYASISTGAAAATAPQPRRTCAAHAPHQAFRPELPSAYFSSRHAPARTRFATFRNSEVSLLNFLWIYYIISRRVTYYLCALNIFVLHRRRSSAFAKTTSNTKNATNSAKKRELPWSRNSTARSSKKQKMLTNRTRPVRADFQKKHVPKARKTQGFARVCHFDLQS